MKFYFRIQFPAKWFALCALLAMAFGCSKKQTEMTAPNFSSIYDQILGKPQCLNCHQPGGTAGLAQLDFSDPAVAFNDLKRTVESPSSPSTCGSVRRVQDGNPRSSYLLGVLFVEYNSNNFAGSSGCQPPSAHLNYASGLSAGDKSALVQWIQLGAVN